MPDPVFSKDDNPNKPASKLPPELLGKSPEEIAEYFQRREQVLLDRARAVAKPTEKPAEKTDEKINPFSDDVTGQINRLVERKVNEASTTVTGRIQPNLVASCKIVMRDRHKDFARFQAEIEDAMNRMTVEAQMDPQMWEVAYNNVKGRHAQELIDEAVAEAKKPKSPVEGVTHPGSKPTEPAELSDMEKMVAGKYDMTSDEYRGYRTRYEQTEGVMPFTYDSRKPKNRKAS